MAFTRHQWRMNAVYYSLPPLLTLLCFGFVFGLTYAPCYSAMCVENYFPKQVRGHIGLFYSLLAGVGLALWARSRFESVRRVSEYHPALLDKVMIITSKRASVGALLLTLWITGLTFGAIGYWYPAQHSYWMARGEAADWTRYIFRLVWTGVTGHWIDIWIGLVVIPIGRNSVLGRAFQLQQSTLLFGHKLLAYALLVGGLIHGLLYYSFLGAWVSRTSSDGRVFQEFNPDNPALTWHQAQKKGIYSWFVLPTGAVVGLVAIPVLVITSLPILRRVNYNTFYFIHIILAVVIMVLVCLHASTCFYFILPGLLLWVGDWIWRVCNSLRTTVSIRVEDATNGWYRVQLPPRTEPGVPDSEKGGDTSIPDQALISYRLIVPKISNIESHPFTVAAHTREGHVILFRKGPERKKEKNRDREWTWKLAATVTDSSFEKQSTLEARIEGPYIEHVPEFHTSSHVLAIAGGTGITGALSIAKLWLASRSGDATRSLRLVWTIKDEAISHLQEVEQLRRSLKELPNAELVIHASGQDGRIDPETILRGFLSRQEGRTGAVWVYASGPAGLLKSVEAACVGQKRRLHQPESNTAITAVDCHIASFDI